MSQSTPEADRTTTVVMAVVEGVRDVLRSHEVSFDEYRAAVRYLMTVAEAGETPLLLDVFLNSTIVEIENAQAQGSKAAIEGPYYREGAPLVEERIANLPGDEQHQPPLLVRGSVRDTEGKPVADAEIDIWHSTADGRYGGCHDGLPLEIGRGRLRSDAQGRFEVRTLKPVPYHIPNQGPTGELLEKHLGQHSWRPAHVHFKVRKEGFRPLTTQSYFEGGDYVDSDCCNGVAPELVHPRRTEDGAEILQMDFVLASALQRVA